jgi:hypothetical protein
VRWLLDSPGTTARRDVGFLAPFVLHSEDANTPMNANAQLQGPKLRDLREHALRFI